MKRKKNFSARLRSLRTICFSREAVMILVAGATGLVGREICRLLLERGKSVRAMTRKSSNSQLVDDLRKRGAQIAVADFKDPSSMATACRGAENVISTVS